jgi:uncharacterized membrane protein YqjE
MTFPGPPTGDGRPVSASGAAPDVPTDAGLLDLVGRLGSDLTHLVQTEVELAKVEIKEEVTNTAIAAGLLSGTALSGYFVLLMLSFAAAYGLAEVMPTGFAFLIVAVLYALVAGTVYVLGRKRLATVTLVPKKTVRTMKEDLSWLRQQIS